MKRLGKKDEKSDPGKKEERWREKSDEYLEMKKMAGDVERWRKLVPGICPRAEDQ